MVYIYYIYIYVLVCTLSSVERSGVVKFVRLKVVFARRPLSGPGSREFHPPPSPTRNTARREDGIHCFRKSRVRSFACIRIIIIIIIFASRLVALKNVIIIL